MADDLKLVFSLVLILCAIDAMAGLFIKNMSLRHFKKTNHTPTTDISPSVNADIQPPKSGSTP